MDDVIERVQRLRAWLNARRPYYFDLMRIYLGIGLFVKGLQFVRDQAFLADVVTASPKIEFASTAVMHYIPLAHLGGGALMAVGLLTRTSALFQIPILLGAAFVVYLPEGLFTYTQDFEFTALVLVLLILVLLHGGGPISVDQYLRLTAKRREGGA
jgi:uncharacterized membrane protein YphA (DoxX/SURF4 family)